MISGDIKGIGWRKNDFSGRIYPLIKNATKKVKLQFYFQLCFNSGFKEAISKETGIVKKETKINGELYNCVIRLLEYVI